MPTQLLESEFITTNIRSLINNQTAIDFVADDSYADQTQNDTTETTSKHIQQTNFDWGEELKNRLEANRNLSPEARIKEYDLETKFFNEFFKAHWDAEAVKQLMLIGLQLRKDIKVLGFNFKINPILAFLSRKYVIEKLLKTKLLNVNTYKAIHNAIALKQAADSEFFKENNYNIIYCRDLYKKSLKEIQNYLVLQKEILSPSAGIYTAETQTNNKKVFIYIAKNNNPDITVRAENQKNLTTRLPSVQNESTILNSYELAVNIAALITGRADLNIQKKHKKNKSSKALNEISDKLITPEQKLACIQYLSIATGDASISKALSNEEFKGVTIDKLKTASAQVASFLPQAKLSKDDARALVSMLL